MDIAPMTTTTCYTHTDSPLGRLCLLGDGQFLTGLFLPGHKGRPGLSTAWRQADEPFAAACEQLAEYFAGARHEFDVPLRPAGTTFQQRVWRELLHIPFGTTMTYTELARRIGAPAASRAVGHANSRNPIAIIVPCHRVLGSTGNLTGYAGGLDRKQWLLGWERRHISSTVHFPSVQKQKGGKMRD